MNSLLMGCCVFCAERMFAADQRPPSRGRSIEFSQPRNDTVGTNLNQLGTKRESLKELEDDLFKPLQTPKGSLDGVMAPPVRPSASAPSPAQIQRARELLKRREDWVFMLPEDMVDGLTPEEIFNLRDLDPSRNDKETQSMLERYFNRMQRDKKGNGDNKEDDFLGLRKSERKRNTSDRGDFSDRYDKSENQLTESEKSLKRLFSDDSKGGGFFASPGKTATFAEVFGLNSQAPSEPDKAFEARREEFRQLLSQSPAPNGPLASEALELPGDEALRPVLTSPLDTSGRKPFEPGFGAGGPAFGLPGVGAAAPALSAPNSRSPFAGPNVAPAPPPPEPSKPAPPLDVSAPRRRF
jgi:hypothetical protein